MSVTYANPVASLDAETRGKFVVKVYQHVALALAAFIGVEYFLFSSGVAEKMVDVFAKNSLMWLLLIGIVGFIQYGTQTLANKVDQIELQYAGLFGFAAAEALIFAPFLWIIFSIDDGANMVRDAAAITIVGFVALSTVAYFTRKDLSFLRPVMIWGSLIALGIIVVALLFGLSLGIWFSVAMIGLMGASILYSTQNILKSYPEGAYVAGAVTIFGELMTLFWYVLRLLSQLRR